MENLLNIIRDGVFSQSIYARDNNLMNFLVNNNISTDTAVEIYNFARNNSRSSLEAGFIEEKITQYIKKKKDTNTKQICDFCGVNTKHSINLSVFEKEDKPTTSKSTYYDVKQKTSCPKCAKEFTYCNIHNMNTKKEELKCALFPDKCTYKNYCKMSGCIELHLRNSHGKIYEERQWKNVKKFLSKASGDIIKSDIPVGIEIEAVGNDQEVKRLNIFRVARQVGLSNDMSLRGSYAPIEIQTPPASGNKLEKLITDCTNSLKKDGFTINNSCGLHIHIGIEQKFGNIHKNPMFYKNLFMAYLFFEPVFFALVPHSRRENRFCRSLEQRYRSFLTNKKFINALYNKKFSRNWYLTDSEREIKDRIREKRDETKYLWCNFHSIFRKQGLEIRLMEGSLDHIAILNWIKLHQLFIEKVVSMKDRFTNEKEIPDHDSAVGMLGWINSDVGLQNYMLGRADKFSKPPQKNTTSNPFETIMFNSNIYNDTFVHPTMSSEPGTINNVHTTN